MISSNGVYFGVVFSMLQFAADVKAEVVGKPSPTFFNSVLEDMAVDAKNVRTPCVELRNTTESTSDRYSGLISTKFKL
jgi:ribonucleotide monophosphatase NagD (HAD superfamily)